SDRLCHPSRPNVAETRGPRTGVDRAVLVTGFVLVGVDHWGTTAGIPRGAPSCPRPGYRCVPDVLARGVLADHPADLQRTGPSHHRRRTADHHHPGSTTVHQDHQDPASDHHGGTPG